MENQQAALESNYQSMQQTNQVLVTRLAHYHNFMVDLANRLADALDSSSEKEDMGPMQDKVYKAWDGLLNALLDEMKGKGVLIPSIHNEEDYDASNPNPPECDPRC